MMISVSSVGKLNLVQPVLDKVRKILDSFIKLDIPDFVFVISIFLIFVLLICALVRIGRLKARIRSQIKAVGTVLGLRIEKITPVEEKKKKEAEEGAHVEEIREVKKVAAIEKGLREEKAPEPFHPEEVLEPPATPKPVQAAPLHLTEEQMSILVTIADESEKSYQEEALFKVYQLAFEKRERPDFNLDVKKLERLELVQPDVSSGYKVWLKITDKGLACIKKNRQKSS